MRSVLLGTVWVAASLTASGCVVEAPPVTGHDQAVVGAQVTTGDPGVVAMVTSTGRVFCTGTLISPQVVLSAAHCLDEAGGDPAVAAFFGDDATGVGLRVGVVFQETHPGWTGSLSGGHDLSLALLTTAQDPGLVVPVNRSEDLANHIGEPYRVVGFGIHDRATRELDGKKRVGQMKILGPAGDFIELDDVDPDQATAVCQGDSGGPGFVTIGGVELLAGVHSYTQAGCFNPAGDARPDLYYADFIQPFIDANDSTCGKDFQCVRDVCSQDPDCEPCNADGTCTTGCALPDPDCPTSGLGDICQIDRQCMTGQCLTWSGDPHSRFCTQPCNGPADCPVPGMVCRDVPGAGQVCDYEGEPPGVLGQACDQAVECSQYLCVEGSCTYECDVPRRLFCPAGYTCESADGGQTFVCLPEASEGGGCCSTGGGGGGGGGGAGWLAALVALALARPRRWRRRRSRPA